MHIGTREIKYYILKYTNVSGYLNNLYEFLCSPNAMLVIPYFNYFPFKYNEIGSVA